MLARGDVAALLGSPLHGQRDVGAGIVLGELPATLMLRETGFEWMRDDDFPAVPVRNHALDEMVSMKLEISPHQRPQGRCQRVQVECVGKMEKIHPAIRAVFDSLLHHVAAECHETRSMGDVYSFPIAS